MPPSPDPRISALNDKEIQSGDYVLYWMQQSQRAEHNPALDLAIREANRLRLPVVVGFGLTDAYPEANLRHYRFMLEGLADVQTALHQLGIRYVMRLGQPDRVAIALGQRASMIVCDAGYTRHQRQWRRTVAQEAGCRVLRVEGDVVVPVAVASIKAEYAARTFRPRIQNHIEESDRAAFLEELIVRRELAVNFVFYTPDYDSITCLPAWAGKTLAEHATDPREHRYPREELEAARTHDPYWNAAMREMKHTGFMHNYMRMYWGKKILEWSAAPAEAFATTLAINNKYFLDGRDPNSYAGVAWVFGKHDRAWFERSVFGKVRYMAAAGLERKCDIKAYVRKVEQRVRRFENR
jgi:deoxyribodipyrimidine photolyase